MAGGLGRVTEGPLLHPAVRRQVEAARREPAGFASFRNRSPASDEELMRSPLPTWWRWPRGWPRRGRLYCPRGGCSGTGAVTGAIAPRGALRLVDIIGTARLADWHAYLATCQTAFDCLMTSRPVPSPGDFVYICQDAIPTWAQPFVWDCENPEDCSPVLCSSRETVFEGEKQVDRAALRRVVAHLRWE